ncbi:MAG TPA: hypothetical protein VIL30_26205 [Ramlibacter sp.]|jgi:hypothetical protein
MHSIANDGYHNLDRGLSRRPKVEPPADGLDGGVLLKRSPAALQMFHLIGGVPQEEDPVSCQTILLLLNQICEPHVSSMR